MSDNEARRAEIMAELELLDASEAFIAAKETRDEDPDALAAARARVSELRTAQRRAGEANGTRTPVGGIAVATNPPLEA